MTNADDTTKRLSEKLPEMPPEAIIGARKNFGPTTPIRQIIAVEVARLIETRRTTLESVSPENLKEEQGKIAGIRELAGALNDLYKP